MPNIRMIIDNVGDSATLADANANIVTTLPEENIQNPLRSKVCRTTNLSDMIINIDWASSQHLSGAGIFRHNLQSDGTWRLKLYESANRTGALVYDSGALQAVTPKSLGELDWGVDALGASVFDNWDQRFSTIWFTDVTALSGELTLSNSSNSDGYLELGRFFIGYKFEPVTNVIYGLTQAYEEESIQYRTEGGSLRTDGKAPFRRFTMTLDNLSIKERFKLFDATRRVGKRRDMVISVFPESGAGRERDWTMNCKFTEIPVFENSNYQQYKTSFNVVES